MWLPPKLYCSAFPGTPHRCDGVCVRFDCVAWYFWFVWDALQIFIKFLLGTGYGSSHLATDIYWKAVEKLWPPSLKAPFSESPNFTLFYFWVTWHRQPCFVGVYDYIPTFGTIHSRIFQVYIIWYLSSSPESIFWGLKVNPKNLGQILGISYSKIIWRGTQFSGYL